MDALEQHSLHLLAVVLIPPAVIAVWNAIDNVRDGVWRMPSGRVLLAAFASASAGWVHVVVAPSHVADGIVNFCFFVAIAAAQLAWAWCLIARGTRALLMAGVVLNAAVVLVWVASRMGGASIGIVDGLATALELAAVGAALSLRRLGVPISGRPMSPTRAPAVDRADASARVEPSFVATARAEPLSGVLGP